MDISTLPRVKSKKVSSLEEMKEVLHSEYSPKEFLVNAFECTLNENLELEYKNQFANGAIPVSEDSLKKLWKVLRIPQAFSLWIPKDLVRENVNTLLKVCPESMSLLKSGAENYLVDVNMIDKGKRMGTSPLFEYIKTKVQDTKSAEIGDCWLSERQLKFNVIYDNQIVEPRVGDITKFGLQFGWDWTSPKMPRADGYTYTLSCTNGMVLPRHNFGLNLNDPLSFEKDLGKYWNSLEQICKKFKISVEKFPNTKEFVEIWNKIDNMVQNYAENERKRKVALEVGQVPIICTNTTPTQLEEMKLANKILRKEFKEASMLFNEEPTYPNAKESYYDIIYNTTKVAHDAAMIPSRDLRSNLELFAGKLLMKINLN